MPRYLLLLPSLLLLAACKEKNTFAPPPPVPVGVQAPTVRDQQLYAEFPGRIAALEVVEVRARVSGILNEIGDGFQPGQRVKEDTLLFKIDDAVYLAQEATAEADIKKAEADKKLAQDTLDARIAAGAGVSKIQVETARAQRDLADAALDAANARLIIAKEDVNYCTIHAPISGRISELLVDRFNLVGTGEPTLLCTIVNDSSMHVYFEANEREALSFLKLRKGYEEIGQIPPTATLTLADGTVHPEQAQLELADNRLDTATGTLRIRAVVPNPGGQLADGLFVHVKVPHPQILENAILVPMTAIQQDLGGYFVLTVGEGNKVVRKNLTLGERVDTMRLVKTGLTGEEKIITVGLQRVREGIEVAPKETPPTANPAPAAAAPGPTPAPAPAPSAE